ncbi:hypothetical protein MTO96_009678 [Rhipicephalus appendiculatus]
MRRSSSPPFRGSFKDATRSLLSDPDSLVIGDGPAQRLILWLVFGRRFSLVRRRARASQTMHRGRLAARFGIGARRLAAEVQGPRTHRRLPGSLQPRENSDPLCSRGSGVAVHATAAASKVGIQRSLHRHSSGGGNVSTER